MAEFVVNPQRFDPYKNLKFRLKGDGRYVAGVSKVSALKRTTEPVKHREGGDPSTSRKPPGRTEHEGITRDGGGPPPPHPPHRRARSGGPGGLGRMGGEREATPRARGDDAGRARLASRRGRRGGGGGCPRALSEAPGRPRARA